jgi:PASTA domain
MSGPMKGGLFVGAAVAAGLLAGFLVPPLVVGRESARGSRSDAHRQPAMPNLAGRPLDEAEAHLGRRGISYVTDRGDIFGVVVPSLWEVCQTEPPEGERVRGPVHLRAALRGTCSV